jgi:ATP-dependent Clp protease ATP-binding subunit ClpA
MFERYTEKARRVIFFARYEASQYGSRNIDTEHLLLGLMRESRLLMQQLLGPIADENQIRAEIEKFIKKGKRFATSVEVPLSDEAKRVLTLAAEEATKLENRFVGPEHLLLGLLRVDRSRAARILDGMGGKLAPIREKVGRIPIPASAGLMLRIRQDPVAELHKFLARLASNAPEELGLSFSRNAQMVDFKGTRWSGRDEIQKESQNLFAAYAQENATSYLESVEHGPGHTHVASVLWKNIMAEGKTSALTHRMMVFLAPEGEEWVVFFLQVTPVVSP